MMKVELTKQEETLLLEALEYLETKSKKSKNIKMFSLIRHKLLDAISANTVRHEKDVEIEKTVSRTQLNKMKSKQGEFTKKSNKQKEVQFKGIAKKSLAVYLIKLGKSM